MEVAMAARAIPFVEAIRPEWLGPQEVRARLHKDGVYRCLGACLVRNRSFVASTRKVAAGCVVFSQCQQYAPHAH